MSSYRIYEKLYYSILGDYCYLTNKSGSRQGLFSRNVSSIIDLLSDVECATLEEIETRFGIPGHSDSEASLLRVLEDLSSVGFFSPAAEKIEYHSIDSKIREHLNRLFLKKPVPLTVDFEITSKCNLRCIHCYNSCSSEGQFLSLDRFAEIVHELKTLGTLFVGLSGGEPLLHPQLKQMIEICDQEGLLVTILTNATMLTEEFVSFSQSKSVQVFKVSFYSSDAGEHDAITTLPGSHAQTEKHLLEYSSQVPFVLQCPIMHPNRNCISDTRAWANRNQIPVHFSLGIVAKSDLSNSNLGARLSLPEYQRCRKELGIDRIDQFFPEWDHRKLCYGGFSSLAVSVSGTFYLCPLLKMPLNTHGESVTETWRASPELENIRSIRRSDFTSCADCAHKANCHICLADNYNETGSLMTIPEYTCKKRGQ